MIRSQLACIIPGMKASSSSAAYSTTSASYLAPSRTHVPLEEEAEGGERSAYRLYQQRYDHHNQHQDHFKSSSSQPGLANASSDSSSTATWADTFTLGLEGLDLTGGDQSESTTVISHLSGSDTYFSSPPTSPLPVSSKYRGAACGSPPRSPLESPPVRPISASPADTPKRQRRRPLTSPLPRSSPQRGRQETNSELEQPLPLMPALAPCPRVLETTSLLKRIKHQINALKRREARLGTELQVQRRERQQMREQIAYLEARRLRVEALFLRPLPLILLLPVDSNDYRKDDQYDLCLVSEGNDSWNALEPLMRINLVQHQRLDYNHHLSSSMGAVLVHFGPTKTQTMAAALSFVDQGSSTIYNIDLQQRTKEHDLAFWERVTSLKVVDDTVFNRKELDGMSCQFLFDALMEHKELWRHQLTQVVDKKTRQVLWVLQQEVDPLYYEPIPTH